jgi:hypothetical protein
MTPSPHNKKQTAIISGQGAIDKFLMPIQSVVDISDDDDIANPKDGCAVPAISPLKRKRIINDDDDDDVSAQPQHKEQPSNINLAVKLQPQGGSPGPHKSQKTPAIKKTVTASKQRKRNSRASKPSNRTIQKRTAKKQVSSRNG